MKIINTSYIILTSLLIFVASCKKSPPTPIVEYKKSKGVFICNEGNYTYGNASLSFYDPNSKTIDNQVFYNANDFPLGDVCMSIAIKDTSGFLVINNSGKIIVLNTNTFKHIATITGLTSPRYVLIISNTKAYISDLYNTNITIFNPENFEITGSICIGNSTENMVQFGNTVFVTSWSYHNKVYKINTDTDKLTDSITVAKQPNSIVLDKNNKLWVLSDGGFPGIPGGQDTAALTKIDAATFTIEKTNKFSSSNASPTKLKINGTKDTLFFINGTWAGGGSSDFGIFKMPVNAEILPDIPFIPQEDNLFYGLGIDPVTSEIYVSDAIDYLQKGIVYRFSSAGSKIDSFKTDIIPSYFGFKK